MTLPGMPPRLSGYHLYHPNRKQPAAFSLVVEALPYRGEVRFWSLAADYLSGLPIIKRSPQLLNDLNRYHCSFVYGWLPHAASSSAS